MEDERPYHHGRLRTVLLAEAERTLREHGVEQLSLRDLARQAGVSHAAPRRHFPDRQALLDALAEAGFDRLRAEVRTAMDNADNADNAASAGNDSADTAANNAVDTAAGDYPARLRAAATAFVRFATRDAALLELMFAAKNAERSATLRDAATQLFALFGALIRQAQEADVLPAGDPERLQLLLAATMQGIATLVTTGRVDPAQTDALIDDAVTLFCRN